jgi:hypothetical protein
MWAHFQGKKELEGTRIMPRTRVSATAPASGLKSVNAPAAIVARKLKYQADRLWSAILL